MVCKNNNIKMRKMTEKSGINHNLMSLRFEKGKKFYIEFFFYINYALKIYF